MLLLLKLILKLPKKGTVVLSMQSNFFSVLLCLILNYKINIRVSEDPCGATKYADNIIFAWFINLTKLFTYNFASMVITNASKKPKLCKKICFDKKRFIFYIIQH